MFGVAKLSDKPENLSVRTVSTSEHHLRTLKKFKGIYIQFESKVTVKLNISKRSRAQKNYSEYLNFFLKIKRNFIGYVTNFPPGIMSSSLSPVFLSRPELLAITFWGIFELIIKESGDHSRLALYARSRHPPLALLACLQLSHIVSRCSPLSLGKSCERGSQHFT